MDDEVPNIESMPNLEPNYEVFMKWAPPPIIWSEFYSGFIMEAHIR